jgi:hypothetical protein
MLEPFLPVDIYAALLETIPDEAFFVACGNGTSELQMPPRLAPIPSIVAWRFLTDVVAALMTPALVARFHERLDTHLHTLVPALPPLADMGVEMGLLESRLVRRVPQAAERDGRTKAWDFLTTVVDFGPLGDRPRATRANAAVTVMGCDLHHIGIVADLSRTSSGYMTYEFAIGPTAKGRGVVAAHAGDEALRAAGLA